MSFWFPKRREWILKTILMSLISVQFYKDNFIKMWVLAVEMLIPRSWHGFIVNMSCHTNFISPFFYCDKKHITWDLPYWQSFKCTVQYFNYMHHVVLKISRTFSSCNVNPIHITQQLFISPSFQSLATISLSVSMTVTTVYSSYKWNHAVFAFCDRLNVSSGFIHVVTYGRISFL